MKKLIHVLWPSFVVAGIANGLLFTALDPADLELSRTAAYSIGFFSLWAMAAASSAFTCFLQRSAEEVNRCPLAPGARPAGCPKREDAIT